MRETWIMDNGSMELRDYQLDMLSRIRKAWRSHQSVMVQMPTGTGKTHVLAEVVSEELRVKNEESYTNAGGVWIVAHRRELVAQIEETIHKIHSEESGSSFFTHRSSLIKVVSIQWLARHWDDIGEKPSLIVIDEAHHALAETYTELWRRFPEARKLGMTATPCRMNHKGFTDLFDVLLTSWSIAEFIRKGQLSLFDYVSIRPGSEAQRLIDSLEKRGADGDYQLKELDTVLNRRPSIERLYRSMYRYARDKKGIVYAISIDHARRIAAYYNNKGIRAVAIDSKTPAAERKRLVEDFKEGLIQVLVNVDVFSEGFDCPDVEFVQLARPTLSLSKYLQQVGRGLRKAEGKESCLLIDNVGLYRVFGLPTVSWDWEAMFLGMSAGKGSPSGTVGTMCCPAVRQEAEPVEGDELELVVSHERLLELVGGQHVPRSLQEPKAYGLKAWQDDGSGLWGLRRGRTRLTDARYVTVFDIRYDMAAVRLEDNSCCLVDESGGVVWRKSRLQGMKFLKNRLLSATAPDGRECWIDLYSLRAYDRRPEVRKYGGIGLLKVDRSYYSRTRTVYVNSQGINEGFITRRKFYLAVLDCKMPSQSSGYQCGYACILEGDHDSYYWLYRWLADGSIVVRDPSGRYYHVEEGRPKRHVGNDGTERDEVSFRESLRLLVERAESNSRTLEAEKEERRRRLLEDSGHAVPFRSGVKWGLKVGNRITVPPVYRTVRPPVGRYCAVEKNYSQWGVVAIDGTVLVEPKYPSVSIDSNGTALLTSVTGKTVSVKL